MSTSLASADCKTSLVMIVGPTGVSGLWGGGIVCAGLRYIFDASERTFSGRGVERGRPLLRFGG